jgi:hypothetical protein
MRHGTLPADNKVAELSQSDLTLMESDLMVMATDTGNAI